jgi:outer membrane protein OmpA-like peptidoglycan-associated protein
LRYRVEQVFLVHRRTSLVVRHVQVPPTRGQDPDLVSAMLSAIQDFIHHSFDAGEYAGLHVVQAGDLTIWIEQGPLAFFAAAIRGSPPLELRIQFRSVLEEIHAKYSSELQNFQGDAAPFEPVTELLENCLVFKLTEPPEKKKPVFALSFCAMLAALLAVALLLFIIEAQRWKAYVAQLNKEPGIHVTSAQRGWWQHSIYGLRDPVARDPMQMLRKASVDPNKVRADWRPYISAAPDIVLLRARRRLNPPDGVALAYNAGTLRALGVAPATWTADAEKSALSIPGVERFDASGVESPEQRQFEKLKSSIEDTAILFDRGSAVLTPQQAEAAQNAAAALEELTKLADTAGKTVQVRVIGRTDRDGGVRENLALGRKRAQVVAAIFQSHGIASDMFDKIGVGTTDGRGVSQEDKVYDRSVVIRVTWKDKPSDKGSNP